jgi:hypothetical protein
VTARKASGVPMDVLSLLRLTVRRWRVTAPAAVLTLLALVAAVQVSSPTYQATGSMVLLAPPDPPQAGAPVASPPTTAEGQNPFARYGDLAVMADILARTMSSETRRATFDPERVTGYEVVANRFQRGPVVEVTGQGPTPEAAVASTEIVLSDVAFVLEKLQQDQGADPGYYIRSAPLEPASDATAMYGSTLRAGIAVLAVGALVTIGLAVLAEAVVQRRQRPKAKGRKPATATRKKPAGQKPAGQKPAGQKPGQPKANKRTRQPRQPVQAPVQPDPAPADNGRSGVGANPQP